LEEFKKQGNEYLHLGRQLELEKQTKSLKATLWMNDPSLESISTLSLDSSKPRKFPIKITSLLPLLELIGMGSQNHVKTLLEFFNVQLPPGFPVQVEIPMDLLPLSATISFKNVHLEKEIKPEIFSIPSLKDGFVIGNVI
jgi:hypothetical protein